MTSTPARGTRGFLIRTGETYMFRVYHDDEFTDYDIRHYDLEIEILDEDSAFYDGRVLDHAPDTLGLNLK
jgi:hypothetical protein